MIVGTSDTRSEFSTSYVFAGRKGFVRNYTGPPIEGLELPTLGRNFQPGVFQLAEGLLSGEPRHFRWGSELPTPTDFSGLSACVPVCAKVNLHGY